ncbi:N-acetylmuramoyl-L-alanine amidase [Desulfitobacterium hafniense]|uniref:N-acetylmuramoyl-L-alanine amidase n=1 Tax=Desulfitobacterium hafniense TaxID=49338 RepID=A0A098AUW0_DESHA|nr:N-acetylmuramoyl-L-alanine amidase [Desulfitobacterium hafniense]CDV96341.1 N-acetylmuramoyl-L-alanine amidase [Desulfitobacterium hafniense]
MTKIFIDPGHGGGDPGAVSKIKEADYTLPYALELGRVLKSLGLQVGYTRTADVFMSLSDRGARANQAAADYFISIHFNAGGGIGVETYALSAGGNAEKLARAVQAPLVSYTGMANRGVKFANFQVLRDTKMPAILIEGGFVDSADADKIKTEANKQNFVRGVSKGLCAFLGLPWSDPYAVPAETPKPADDPDVYLSVRVRTSKADAVVEQIIKMGYACKRLDLA